MENYKFKAHSKIKIFDDENYEGGQENSRVDAKTDEFLSGKGEFGVLADIEFEEHLERLRQGSNEKLWYRTK